MNIGGSAKFKSFENRYGEIIITYGLIFLAMGGMGSLRGL